MEDPAIARFKEMLAKDPRSMAFAPLAEAYRKGGRLDEAIAAAEAGLKIHPGYMGGLVVLGRALFEKGQVDRSYEVLEKVARENPDNYMAAKTVAKILALRGQVLPAREAFLRVKTLMPGDPEVEAELARLEPMAAAEDAKLRAVEEGARRRAEEERLRREEEARAKEEAERAAVAAANPFATGGHIQALLSNPVGFGGGPEDELAPESGGGLPAFVMEEPPAAPPGPALSDSAAEGTIATETLARLYAQQGARDEAEAIYRTMGKAPGPAASVTLAHPAPSSAGEASFFEEEPWPVPEFPPAEQPPAADPQGGAGVLATLEGWLANAERMRRR